MSTRGDHLNRGITESLNRQWAELRRPKALATNARALAYLFANGGTASEHGEARTAGFTDEDYAAVDRLDADLPAILTKLDREVSRVQHNGVIADEHGFTPGFLGAWLWAVCDAEGQARHPTLRSRRPCHREAGATPNLAGVEGTDRRKALCPTRVR